MFPVSRWEGAEAVTKRRNCSLNKTASLPWGRNIIPGFVQNWPAPSVKEVCSPVAMVSPRSRNAPGKMNRGLVLLISA